MYNYAEKGVYSSAIPFLCTVYAELPTYDSLFYERLRERFENLSVTRRNLSLRVQNLSVSRTENSAAKAKMSFFILQMIERKMSKSFAIDR